MVLNLKMSVSHTLNTSDKGRAGGSLVLTLATFMEERARKSTEATANLAFDLTDDLEVPVRRLTFFVLLIALFFKIPSLAIFDVPVEKF